MKKNIIAILSFLIILLLAFSILTPAWYSGTIFMDGFNEGLFMTSETRDKHKTIKGEEDKQLLDIAFNPDVKMMLSTTDSIEFNDGRKYPLVITRASVVVPHGECSPSLPWISMLLYFLSFLLFCIMSVKFIIFIIRINKGRIFELQNVKSLNSIGWFLITIGILKIGAGITDDIMLGKLGLELEGYALTTFRTVPYAAILLGLFAMLMSRIWNIGLETEERKIIV